MLDVSNDIAGYDYGKVGRAPLSLDDLRRLEATVGFTDDDRRALAEAGEILTGEAEALVNEWRGIIGSQDHLARWFVGADCTPDDAYKAAVKPRFVRWVVDLCTRPFDQAWLDYQYEIGLRRTPRKKNATDDADTPSVVPLRYVLAFIAPVIASAKAHLEKGASSREQADRMLGALSVAIWALPYTRDELW